MGRGDRKRKSRRKARTASKQVLRVVRSQNQPEAHERAAVALCERPTPERHAQGTWAEAEGSMKSRQPIVDLAADQIGRLYTRKQITSTQEQAARHWQELRARYLAELPEISGYKSCLAGSVPGYDDSDGNPAVIAEYRTLEGKLGVVYRRELLWVCDEGNEPTSVPKLRAALDVVAQA